MKSLLWPRCLRALPAAALVLMPLAAAAHQVRSATLAGSIDAILDDPGLAAGIQGVCIERLEDKHTLYTRNAHRAMLPASNNKLLTSAAALGILGPEFVYRTWIYTTGEVNSSGTVHGDLVLRGSGDPLLTRANLAEMADAMRASGLRQVTGHLRYDDSLFDRQWLGDGWTWDDEPYYYSAQISALNIEVIAAPGTTNGSPVKVTTDPATPYVSVRCEAVTGSTTARTALEFDRVRGQNVITIAGTMRSAPESQQREDLTIENPALYCATLLIDALHADGIRISGGPVDGPPVPHDAAVVAEHVSPPLAVILGRLLKPSDNLVAECLLKTIGAVSSGKGTAGFGGSGSSAARIWLTSAGLNASEFRQLDGSGLSRMNFVSAASFVRLLEFMAQRKDFSLWYNALPIAGVDGTLRNRMKSTAAAGNCHAKTGSLSHVSTLSGYVTDHDGKQIAFSILMNNHLGAASACSRAQDRIVEILANYSDQPEATAAARNSGTNESPHE